LLAGKANINSFEELEEMLKNIKYNTGPIRKAKSPAIFVSKVNDPSSLRQLHNEITKKEFYPKHQF